MGRDHKLVTFGEAMIRFSTKDHERLEQAQVLDVHVGGSELNVAVAAAHLGLSSSFVTRLTRGPLGRRIEIEARKHGVDTSNILWTDDDRVGTYYLEPGASPRANAVVYDRRHTAISQIRPGDVDWGKVLSGAEVLHTSGITPALSVSAAEATLEAVRAAAGAGLMVSVDLNYRARLWSEADARTVMTEVVKASDVLITTEEDTQRVFGIEGSSFEEVARELAKRFDLKAVAITLRETPSVWRNQWSAIALDGSTGEIHRGPTYDIEVVDRVGSGDSFAGGFLYGLLEGDIETAVRYGVAISAIKQTLPGDVVYTTKDEVERTLEGGGLRIVR